MLCTLDRHIKLLLQYLYLPYNSALPAAVKKPVNTGLLFTLVSPQFSKNTQSSVCPQNSVTDVTLKKNSSFVQINGGYITGPDLKRKVKLFTIMRVLQVKYLKSQSDIFQYKPEDCNLVYLSLQLGCRSFACAE